LVVSFWTDIIAYSPTWVDIRPEKVRRFIATVAGGEKPCGVVGVPDPEMSCYGVLDVKGEARKAAADADLEALYKKLSQQAKKYEALDCEATGEFEPPSWTEDSAEHIGPYLCIEGTPSKICRALAGAEKIPFADLEVTGLRAGDDIVKELSLADEDSYLDLSEINLEIGPTFSAFLNEPPEFCGWARVILSGEGQPHPLTKAQLIEHALKCDALQRIVTYAGECFGVPRWQWTVGCSG
jgi:hypothetical protein